jgi:diguanylate cyclase (GGDEF)-like protein
MSADGRVIVTERAATRARRMRASARGTSPIWFVYGCFAVCLVAYVIVAAVRPDSESWPWLDNWGVAGFEIAVSALCLVRAATVKRGRATALALGLGIMSWALGDLVLAIESAGGGEPPSPSLADGFYIAFYPLSYIGLMLLVRRQVRRLNRVTWLDGAIAGLGAAAICGAFAFRHLETYAGGGGASVATNLAYPIGDVLLLAIVVAGTAVLPGRRRAQWLMLAAGYTLNAVGDSANLFHDTLVTTQLGTFLDEIAWPTAILLVSASVWLRPSHSSSLAEERQPGFVLPGLAACAALVILVTGTVHHTGRVAIALAVATLLVAGVRSALSLVSLRALTDQRHRQAVTDQLTGLGNRRGLFSLLDAFFPEEPPPEGEQRSLAFLYVDLNGFKEINDSFGHAAGDELLRQLGRRLGGSLRDSDLLVRLGGDEFGVALVDSEADFAATVAERLTARLEEPFVLEAVRARISASIGIAIAPSDASTAHDLLRCADVAMYRAKLAGKAFAIYQEDLDGSGNRMRLVEELRVAIEQRKLELHYQPQVALASGEIVAVEALIRWAHPRLGFVPPLEFLPLAEEAGLMGRLTTLALENALAQCARWHVEGKQLTVSVNISSSTLLDATFSNHVRSLLARYAVPANALVLEVTETTAIADFERAKVAIEQLRELGLTVSVDDFGAGFTSLAYLSSLAVGELKLDRSFITGLATEDRGRDLTLVRSTIELAHALGLRVVAEGVEDEPSLELLTELGCDLAQGYLISRPKPASELTLVAKPRLMGPAIEALAVTPAAAPRRAPATDAA